jgi:hypothetical protein
VQPNCTPLAGWRFTIGNAIALNPITGTWGSLSVVSGADATNITTLASIPRRNNIGQIHPNQTVQGATTIELTQAQLNRAPNGNLWIQGGTPTDPVLSGDFPDEFGFGALRCATDNLNGDNVEFIRFPTGSRHVYCFAYYVTPPPTSGTIVIRKQVTDPANADQRFTFEGNISFTPDHRFDLNVVNGSTRRSGSTAPRPARPTRRGRSASSCRPGGRSAASRAHRATAPSRSIRPRHPCRSAWSPETP